MNNLEALQTGENRDKSPAEKIFDKIAAFEKGLVAVCLAFMVILVLAQIALRNLFNSGIPGGDSMVKHMVLWVGFLGAGLATRDGNHVRIDVASKILPRMIKPFAQIMADVFSLGICILLFIAAYQFVVGEYHTGAALPFMEIPVWLMEVIIPIGFLTITVRFTFQAGANLKKIWKG